MAKSTGRLRSPRQSSLSQLVNQPFCSARSEREIERGKERGDRETVATVSRVEQFFSRNKSKKIGDEDKNYKF